MKGGGAGGGASEMLPRGHQPALHRRLPRGHERAQPARGDASTTTLHNGNPLAARPAARPVAARRRHERPRAARHRHRARRPLEGMPRETGFDITAASEVMAILCLAQRHADLKRASRAASWSASPPTAEPVTAGELRAAGAMPRCCATRSSRTWCRPARACRRSSTAARSPTSRTACNSVPATRAAMHLRGMVVTEAGFGFDLGAEKFFDINCRYGGLAPALHGAGRHGARAQDARRRAARGPAQARRRRRSSAASRTSRSTSRTSATSASAGRGDQPLPDRHGRGNRVVQRAALCSGAGRARAATSRAAARARGARGGGARRRARAARFRPLYELGRPVEQKIATVAREMYGAKAVDFTARAKRDLEELEKLGFAGLPVCIAKTQQSLSDNPALRGRPKDFLVTVREIQLAAGAGFLVVITGEILRMPGLPKVPLASGSTCPTTARCCSRSRDRRLRPAAGRRSSPRFDPRAVADTIARVNDDHVARRHSLEYFRIDPVHVPHRDGWSRARPSRSRTRPIPCRCGTALTVAASVRPATPTARFAVRHGNRDRACASAPQAR